MNRYCAFFAVLLTLWLQAVTAWSADSDAPVVSYFTDKQRGWFWYEVQPEPVVKKPPEAPKPKPISPADSVKVQPKPPTVVPAEPAPLSSAWLRKNLETYLNKAIDEPTHENVAAFYYLQRAMMDKAERFTHAARYVVISDPQLDETVRRPVATYAVNEANHQASMMADKAMKDIAGLAGILFFFRSDCRYCHA